MRGAGKLHLSRGSGMLPAETPRLVLFSCRNVSKSNQETRLSGGNKPRGEGREGRRLPPMGTGSRCATLRCKNPFALSKHQDFSFPQLIGSPRLQTQLCFWFWPRTEAPSKALSPCCSRRRSDLLLPRSSFPGQTAIALHGAAAASLAGGERPPGAPAPRSTAQGLSPAPPACQQTAGRTIIWGNFGLMKSSSHRSQLVWGLPGASTIMLPRPEPPAAAPSHTHKPTRVCSRRPSPFTRTPRPQGPLLSQGEGARPMLITQTPFHASQR